MVRDHERDTDDTALDARVSALLSAAAAPSEPGPLPGEGAALAAFRAAHPEPRRSPHRGVLVAARSGVAAAMAGLLLTGGVAATAGVLPDVAQDTVDAVLVDLGLDPRTDDATREDATVTDTSEPAVGGDSETAEETGFDAADGTGSEEPGGAADAAPSHGDEVSRTARETEAAGAEKGAEVSGLASRGRSRAGEERGGAVRPDVATQRSGARASRETPGRPSPASPAKGSPRR